MSLLNQQRPYIEVAPPDPRYPCYRFHPEGKQMRVEREQDEPGSPWADKPFPPKEPELELTDDDKMELLQQEVQIAKAETATQRKRFDTAWEGITQEFDALKEAHERLLAEHESVSADRDRLALEAETLKTEAPAEEAPVPKNKKGK